MVEPLCPRGGGGAEHVAPMRALTSWTSDDGMQFERHSVQECPLSSVVRAMVL